MLRLNGVMSVRDGEPPAQCHDPTKSTFTIAFGVLQKGFGARVLGLGVRVLRNGCRLFWHHAIYSSK